MLSLLLFSQIAAAAPPTRFELPNGLRVWVQEEHSRPVALVHITYHAGSLNEGPGLTGIAHYVEHMAYRATENVRNEDAYGYIDRIGGRYTGGTWPEVTRYTETVPSWALESALIVTAERMTRALFDSLEFERERGNVVTEAHGFADSDPANALRDAVMMAAFELHPYRYSSNTWARDNLRLTRAQAYEWYSRYYGPNNAVLVVVGDVATDEVRRLVTKHFGPLRRAPGNGRIDIVEPMQRAEKQLVFSEPADSARLEIVYHAPSARHPAFPALVRFDELFSAGIRQAAKRVDSTVTVETRDTATAYPYVYRVSVAAAATVIMTTVLTAIDDYLESLRAGRASVEMIGGAASRREGDNPSPAPSSAVPPRSSNLTRIAEALAFREMPPWQVPSDLRDSIRTRATRVTAAEYGNFARQWLKRSNRTVGILQPKMREQGARAIARELSTAELSDSTRYGLDIPALTTPPARRLRPGPVPPRALPPLAPLPIESGKGILGNGIPIRAARVSAPQMLLRVVYDYGPITDTLERRFAADSMDAVLGLAARDIASGLSSVPEAKPDTTLEGRARARVVAAVSAPRVLQTSAALSVALVGPMDPARATEIAARHFSRLPSSRPFRARQVGGAAARLEQIAVPGAKQVEIVAGLPGVPANHTDRRALELLSYIVGVPYYGGRLGWALTKTGLTYSSAAQTYFGESGYILLSTTADTRNTPATIQAIREVVGGVGERGVEEWELKEAQAFLLGRTMLYGAREDSPPATIAAALTNSDAAGLELLDLPALSRAYLSVTLEEINRVARSYYRPERLHVVAMGAIPTGEMRSPFAAGTFRGLFEP
jgi:predicted Zn-dependent peptidase